MALALHHSSAASRQTLIQNQSSHINPTAMDCQHSTKEKLEKKLLRQGSVSENFFAVNNAALILPKQSNFGEPVEGMKSMIFGGDLKTHLYAIIDIVRRHDKIKLVARLESWDEGRMRYLVIVSTVGRQDTEESIIVGIDFAKSEHTHCTVGLVIPIWSDTDITLDGDGGFKVTGRERTHTFKPISVQAMWSALQSIHHCIATARQNNYYFGSLYLTWTCYYESRVTSPRICLNEWEYCDDVYSRPRYYFTEIDDNRQSTEMKIREKLKEVMMTMDLDNCNSRDIRQALEKKIDLDLKQYKEYIDTEMLTILGQMDTASEILDFLYLGSEWNASNSEELNKNGVSHILNITNEVDNFFPDDFVYKNIRCNDEPTTDLLHMWNDTWKFIRQARRSSGKCLVHCKMGISRSAATVIAFIMKDNRWSMETCLAFVREKRPIVLPNMGFMRQLLEYEGILNASAQRHNFLFRSLSESNLLADHGNPDEEENKAIHGTPKPVTDQPQVDFNRRLLDLPLLSHSVYKPRHRRSKSWSVGDDRPCGGSGGLPSTECTEEGSSMNTGDMSEPRDLFNRSTSASTEKPTVAESRSADRRKRWRRRNTERVITNYQEFVLLDTKPQSEDSVFVSPGVSKHYSADYRLVETTKGSLTSRRIPPKSSPIAETSDCKLDVKIPAGAHSSLTSTMNSPSFKSTKNVNVSVLRGHFDDESTLKIDVSDSFPVVVQSEWTKTLSDGLIQEDAIFTSKAEVGKIKSVPRPKSPCGRSLSDSQVCSVKHIVSNIEQRCSGELFSDVESRETILEHNENPHRDTCPRHERYSDGGAVSTSNMACFSPEKMLIPIPTDIAIIEKDCNQNNNNCKLSNSTLADGHVEKVPIEDKPATFADSSEVLGSDCEKSRSLTQSELEVIREVGRTFLGETDSSDPELLSESFLDSKDLLSDNSANEDKVSTVKKRGIVRRMAKMIENRIKRQLQRKAKGGSKPQTETSIITHSDSSSKHTSLVGTPIIPMKVNLIAIPDVIIREEPPNKIREDAIPNITSSSAMSSRVEGQSFLNQSFFGQSKVSDIISLVGPTPYSPVRALMSAPRVTFRKNPERKSPTVRRSQSERGTGFPKKHRLRSTGALDSNDRVKPFLVEENNNVDVKNAVKMIEEQDSVIKENSGLDTGTSPPNFAMSGGTLETRYSNARLHSNVSCGASEEETDVHETDLPARSGCSWISRENCLYQTI